MVKRGLAEALGWMTLGLVVLAALGGAARVPGGVAIGWPGAPAAIAAVIAVGILARLQPSLGRAALGLAPFVLSIAAGSPIPGLGLWSGPPLLAVCFGFAAVVLGSAERPWARRALFPVVLVLYAAVSVRVQQTVGPEGDEPHYLMVADSILRDGDLAVEADFDEGRYHAFHDDVIEPHYRVRGRGGTIYSLHAVGLSILILPAWALGGYPVVSLFMALLGALLVRQIAGLVEEWTGDRALGTGTAWIAALSPPLVHYAGLVFTEVPAALALTAAFRRARDDGGRAGYALCGGLLVAALPWLNVRNAALTVVVVAYVLSGRPSVRRAAAWVLPCVVSAMALMAYHWTLYGFFDPRRVYGRRPEFALSSLAEGLPGLLVDQEFGLLVYAPVFALILPGLWHVARDRGRAGLAVAALVLLTFATAGTWHMWRGGFNPPARFLVPIAGILALAVGVALGRRGLTWGRALLIGWSVWTGLAGALDPWLVHRDRDGTAPLFRVRSGADEWTRVLPGYVMEETRGDRARLALVWAGALLLGAVAGRPKTLTPAVVAAGTLLSMGLGAVAVRSTGVRAGGREAVRVAGRPSIGFPAIHLQSSTPARWTGVDLSGGALFDPNRRAEGLEVGERLSLPAGSYRLRITFDDLGASQKAPPYLEVRTEPRRVSRVQLLTLAGDRLETRLDVSEGERSTSLLLRGGGPLRVKAVELDPEDPR